MMDQNHEKMHWGCCWVPMLNKGLWLLAFLSLIGGLIALAQGGSFWGITVMTWYWNALVGGILSLGAKGMKRHACCETTRQGQ